MKRLYGARDRTVGVTTIHARIGNYVSHPKTSNGDAIIARLIYTEKKQAARTKLSARVCRVCFPLRDGVRAVEFIENQVGVGEHLRQH